jgi:predicted  nucleic acid-binding Zn-ribbon protein
MDMNILGELIVASGAQDSNGFWMPAGGNDGVGGVEVFLNTVTESFEVSVETKSSDQADSSATPIGSVTIDSTTPGNYKFNLTNAKDLVRYVVSATKAGKIHFQVAQPLWHPN